MAAWRGWRKRARSDPAATAQMVLDSGLRGRGGAGFPTGIKWKTVADAPRRPQKYIVCNADEGDSGTYADRMLMEGDPFSLIEGMVIAGLAVGRHARVTSTPARNTRMPSPPSTRRWRSPATPALLGRRLRHRAAGRRRRLYLRRGNLAAGKPGGQARAGARQAAAAGAQGPVRLPDRHQQPDHAGDGAGDPARRRRGVSRLSAWDARAAPCRSSWPATSATADCSRRRSASRWGSW